MQFTNSLTIECPIHEVFAFISDFENMPKWNYFVVEVRKTSPGQIGLGTTFHQRRKTDQQDYTITEYEPDRKVTVTTTPHLAGSRCDSPGSAPVSLQNLARLSGVRQ